MKNKPEFICYIWLVVYNTFSVYPYCYLERVLMGRCIPNMHTMSWTQDLQRLCFLSYCCIVTIMVSLCSHKHPQSGGWLSRWASWYKSLNHLLWLASRAADWILLFDFWISDYGDIYIKVFFLYSFTSIKTKIYCWCHLGSLDSVTSLPKVWGH